jgi:hypothetical protein
MHKSKKSAEAVGNRLIAFSTKKLAGHRLTLLLIFQSCKNQQT